MTDLHTYHVEETDDQYILRQRGPDGDGDLSETDLATIPKDAAECLLMAIGEDEALATLTVQQPGGGMHTELNAGDGTVIQAGPVQIAVAMVGAALEEVEG